MHCIQYGLVPQLLLPTIVAAALCAVAAVGRFVFVFLPVFGVVGVVALVVLSVGRQLDSTCTVAL